MSGNISAHSPRYLGFLGQYTYLRIERCVSGVAVCKLSGLDPGVQYAESYLGRAKLPNFEICACVVEIRDQLVADGSSDPAFGGWRGDLFGHLNRFFECN